MKLSLNHIRWLIIISIVLLLCVRLIGQESNFTDAILYIGKPFREDFLSDKIPFHGLNAYSIWYVCSGFL